MTLTTQAVEEVIKSDTLGRTRTSAARREHLLGEFAGSGMSAKRFAELAGIKYQTFATWLQQHRRQHQSVAQSPSATDPVKWLEAMVEQSQKSVGTAHAGLVLHLPGGARVEIGDASQAVLAAVLVRALARSC